jgi:hypothetical protein
MNLVPTSLDNTNMPPDKSPIPVACGLLALSPPPHPSGEANSISTPNGVIPACWLSPGKKITVHGGDEQMFGAEEQVLGRG